MIALEPGLTAVIVSSGFGALTTGVGLYLANRTRRRSADVESVKNDQQFLRDIIETQAATIERLDVQVARLEKRIREIEGRGT